MCTYIHMHVDVCMCVYMQACMCLYMQEYVYIYTDSLFYSIIAKNTNLV